MRKTRKWDMYDGKWYLGKWYTGVRRAQTLESERPGFKS